MLPQTPALNGSRPYLMNAFEERGGVERVLPNQASRHGNVVQHRYVSFVSAKRLDFAGEHHRIPHHGSAERFDAHGVSCEDQLARGWVPQCDGVHAVQGGQPRGVVLGRHGTGMVFPACCEVGGQDRLGVTCGLKRVGCVLIS